MKFMNNIDKRTKARIQILVFGWAYVKKLPLRLCLIVYTILSTVNGGCWNPLSPGLCLGVRGLGIYVSARSWKKPCNNNGSDGSDGDVDNSEDNWILLSLRLDGTCRSKYITYPHLPFSLLSWTLRVAIKEHLKNDVKSICLDTEAHTLCNPSFWSTYSTVAMVIIIRDRGETSTDTKRKLRHGH